MNTPPHREPLPRPDDRHPLPVHWVDLAFHFHPSIGHGRLAIHRWSDVGLDAARDYQRLTLSTLGPFDEPHVIRRQADRWCREVAKITGWEQLLGFFGPA